LEQNRLAKSSGQVPGGTQRKTSEMIERDLMAARDQGVLALSLAASIVGEQLRRAVEQLLFPLSDLRGRSWSSFWGPLYSMV